LQTPGRLLKIRIDGESYDWGILISCKKQKVASENTASRGTLTATQNYLLEVLLFCVDRHFDSVDKKGKDEDLENVHVIWNGSNVSCRPIKPSDDKKIQTVRVFSIGLNNIENLSAVRLFVPQEVTRWESRRKMRDMINEVIRRFPEGVPLLDPVTDLGIQDEAFMTQLKRAEMLAERLAQHKLTTDFDEQTRTELVHAYEQKIELLEKAKRLREEARQCQSMVMKDDLKKMKRVLKKLGHVDGQGIIQTKGRTACEVNTADELIITELIFSGVFTDLSVEQCVALLSCMIFDERIKDDGSGTSKLPSQLMDPFTKLKEVARGVARVKASCNIEINEDEYVDKLNPGM
jgi:ATP-dependent RNA helicase DOB1